MCRTLETSCRSRTDAVVRAALLAVLLATQCWHGSLVFGQERSRQGNSVRFVVPIASPTTDLRGHSVVSDDDVKDEEASVVLSDDENVRLVGAAEELISLDKLESSLDEVREFGTESRPVTIRSCQLCSVRARLLLRSQRVLGG